MKRKMWKMCGYFWWKWTTYAHLLMTQSHHDHRSRRLIQIIKPLTDWYDIKRPQMVSQALWLKWPHHLLADGPPRGHKWWARRCGWNDHTTYKLMGHKEATNGEQGLVVEMTTYLLMRHKEATNGEPGLVVEMTTPLTPWWGTKRPQMVSHAWWLKWPQHLHPDGAQRGHKWWARPCGWNDHTTYKLMGHKEATNGE